MKILTVLMLSVILVLSGCNNTPASAKTNSKVTNTEQSKQSRSNSFSDDTISTLISGSRTSKIEGAGSNMKSETISASLNNSRPDLNQEYKLPKLVMGSTYSDYKEISFKDNYFKWEYVKANINGWLLHINRIGNEHPAKIPDLYFKPFIGILKENKIELFVESKSYYYDEAHGADIKNIGYHDAMHDIKFLQRVYDEGYFVSSINFDGAFYDYKKAGLSNQEALDNLIRYYSEIHKKWPDIKLYMLFNFPNWGWKGKPAYRTDIPGENMYMGDAYETYNFVISGIKKSKIPLSGITVDNPYDYAMGIRVPTAAEQTGVNIAATDWFARILEFEEMVHNDGYEFSMIFNSQYGGELNGNIYTTNTTYFINKYYRRGGNPDICIMESWYKNPTDWLPESDDSTMAGSVKSAIQAIIENINTRTK